MRKLLAVGYGKNFRELLIKCSMDTSFFSGFYDNHFKEACFANTIPRLEWDSFLEEARNKTNRVVITASDNERLYYCKLLRENGVEYEMYDDHTILPCGTLHISGTYPDLIIDANIDSPEPGRDLYFRSKLTLLLLLTALSTYKEEVEGLNFDIWITVVDGPEEANALRQLVGAEYAFSYCTSFAYDHVIAFPDYRTFYDEDKYEYEETPDKCRAASQTEIVYDRALFIGTLISNPVRRELITLAERTDRIEALERNAYYPHEFNNGANRFIPMLEQAQYKYLIDAPGWTWSDRTKIYLQLGRPILMIERPYKEWFFDELKPMQHYVPIKRDLSDLVQTIEWLDNNEAKYKEICQNALDFSSRVFSRENILKYVKQILV